MKNKLIYLFAIALFHYGCTDTDTEPIKPKPDPIKPNHPKAWFDYKVTSKSPSALVEFTDESRDAEECFWDFGDGQTSTERNTVHTYTKSGDYEAKQVVSSGSWKDSTHKIIRIEGKYSGCYVKTITIIKLPSTRLGGLPWDPDNAPDIWITLKENGKEINTIPWALGDHADYPIVWNLDPILNVKDLFTYYDLEIFDIDLVEHELMADEIIRFNEFDPIYPTTKYITYDDFELKLDMTWY